MKKRGQITVFLVIGMIILILFGMYYYVKSYSAKSAVKNAPGKRSEADIVKAYVESCIKNVAEDALFEKIGEQGGYVDVIANPTYGENGIINSPISPAYTQFQGKNVSYYLEVYCEQIGCSQYAACPVPPCACVKQKCVSWNYRGYIPSLDMIGKKLANYIAVEFENCFKKNIFGDIGIKIEKPVVDYRAINFDFSRTNVNVEIKANEEDTSVMLKYPIIITIGGTETKIDSFIVVLPIRLKALHDSSIDLINNIKAKISNDPAYRDTDFLTEVPYSLSASECTSFDKNGITNVYTKTSDSGKKEIVQFVDFSTYHQYYFNSYIFQFAVRNVNVIGNCVG